MFSLRPLSRSAIQHASKTKVLPWTCLRCSQKGSTSVLTSSIREQRASFATEFSRSTSRHKPRRWVSRRGLLITAAVGLVTYGAAKYTDRGQFVVTSLQRTNRVLTTLILNIREYQATLKLKEQYETKEEWDRVLKACHKRCAVRTLKAMEKNGSIFIKLGQHLTSLNYMLPSEWCDTFIPLQDQCPESSFEDIRNMVEKDLGLPFEEVFSEFEREPLGAASLAQVHNAVDRQSGQHVAVKVQHPVLDDWAPLDLVLTRFTFKTIKQFFPDYDLTWLSDEMQVSLPQELDFAQEGENAMRTRDYFANISNCPLIIPNVLWARRRILTMENISGHRIDDLDYLTANNISRDEVSASLARIFNTMIFAHNAPLHCDPHGGNIAIIPQPSRSRPYNFSIILYDHGLYRHIPSQTQRSYAKLWLAVLDGNEPGMRQYAYDIAGITDEQFPLFASAITGRDYRVVSSNEVDSPRTAEEKEAISDALGDGMLQQLVSLLGQVPKIILLILKTNDLTRSLDTALQIPQGPYRSFLILARYAAKTVYDEEVEQLELHGGILWPPGHAAKFLVAWTRYTRMVLKLGLYEWVLYLRGLIGLDNSDLVGKGLNS